MCKSRLDSNGSEPVCKIPVVLHDFATKGRDRQILQGRRARPAQDTAREQVLHRTQDERAESNKKTKPAPGQRYKQLAPSGKSPEPHAS